MQKREFYLTQQIAFQENKYNQISTAYRNTRAILHETKKHFFYIQSCAENADFEHIKSYLQKAVMELENSYSRINTGNLVIDAFVSSHLFMAEREHISYETNIDVIADHIPIDDYNLCILLGNLLDNSMEECRQILPPRPRKIMVEIFTSDLQFVIHICNSVCEHTERKKSAEYMLYHGYGLENVQTIAERFKGTCLFTEENGQYNAIVVIPILYPQT